MSATRMLRSSSAVAALALSALLGGPSAVDAQTTLGTAQSFGVLGASAVTNTGATTITGNLGVSPGSLYTGGGSVTLIGGSAHITDAVASQAQTDARIAYNALGAMSITRDLTGMDLGGLTLTPGVYSFQSSAQLTGNLFLDFLGNPNSVFVFQIGSTLTTASGSSVVERNGGPGNGVYWRVGSSATLGTSTSFEGSILANTSVTLNTASSILCGRAIALTGAVTMDNNVISTQCLSAVTPTPEPATLGLFATGLVGMFGAASWRRKEHGKTVVHRVTG